MNKNTATLSAVVVATMLLSAMIIATPTLSISSLQLPQIFGRAFASSEANHVDLTATTLPNGQFAYVMDSHIRGIDDLTAMYADYAAIPGPTIVIQEGDTLDIDVNNLLAIDADVEFDEDVADGSAAPGTYLYQSNEQALLGLFGAIIVRDSDGDIGSYLPENNGIPTPATLDDLDREFVLFMVGSTFWGQEIGSDGEQRPLWTNPMLHADLGDITQFHVLSIGHGHTFHLHAHRWVDSGTSAVIDTKLMNEPSDTHEFVVEAGADVGPGHWQYHCHVFAHMEAGMHGIFHVGPTPDAHDNPTESQQGANPYNGHPLLHDPDAPDADKPGLATLIISDEPGSWFRSARADALAPLTVTKSLELVREGDYVNFIMSDTATVHTITSLLWPVGAENMPMDEIQSYKGGGIVQLNEAGLYVFTCKVHPYMFGAVIADDTDTPAVELGEAINLVMYPGLDFPTASDIATRLLKTFFIATAPENWQDYSTDTWHITYPDLAPAGILFKVGTGSGTADVDLKAVLEARYGQDTPLALDSDLAPGVGEVWIDTQFEKTDGKDKPGTATAVDTSTWEVTKKVSHDMNNPHNMWTDDDQSVIYQTEWFSNKLTTFDRESGERVSQIQVGEAPSHVMTRTDTGDIHVALNGEEGVAEILKTTDPEAVERIIPMQGLGQDPSHPHAHWMSADGKLMVTPNSFTGDSSIFNFGSDSIKAKPETGALPIATGMMPDSSKYYVANLLHSTISVIDTKTGEKIKDINGLEDYNPLVIGGNDEAIGDGFWPLDSEGADGILQLAALPIQTPVSPNGEYMVTASTLSATITIVDTETDEIVKTLFCDAGCHGVNFGAKEGGGYYAYVSSKFSNAMIVVDGDPNNDGNPSDAEIVGRILLIIPSGETTDQTDQEISGLDGTGGQGVLAIPVVYNGWVQNLPDEWSAFLTCDQRTPTDKEKIEECLEAENDDEQGDE
jgi:DNA-binding beta-propeller fold protein YncE